MAGASNTLALRTTRPINRLHTFSIKVNLFNPIFNLRLRRHTVRHSKAYLSHHRRHFRPEPKLHMNLFFRRQRNRQHHPIMNTRRIIRILHRPHFTLKVRRQFNRSVTHNLRLQTTGNTSLNHRFIDRVSRMATLRAHPTLRHHEIVTRHNGQTQRTINNMSLRHIKTNIFRIQRRHVIIMGGTISQDRTNRIFMSLASSPTRIQIMQQRTFMLIQIGQDNTNFQIPTNRTQRLHVRTRARRQRPHVSFSIDTDTWLPNSPVGSINTCQRITIKRMRHIRRTVTLQINRNLRRRNINTRIKRTLSRFTRISFLLHQIQIMSIVRISIRRTRQQHQLRTSSTINRTFTIQIQNRRGA